MNEILILSIYILIINAMFYMKKWHSSSQNQILLQIILYIEWKVNQNTYTIKTHL